MKKIQLVFIQRLECKLGTDRFNWSNSALDLNSRYYQVPNGIYFRGAFTISAWIYSRQILNYVRLIDFSVVNTENPDVVLAIFNGLSPTPNIALCQKRRKCEQIISSIGFQLFI